MRGSMWLAVLVAVAGCGTTTTEGVRQLEPTAPPPGSVPTVEGGFAGPESFCGPHGRVDYASADGAVVVRIAATGLPPRETLSLDWRNDDVRGYTVGRVDTSAAGDTVASSVVLFRGGETRGVGVLLADREDSRVVAAFTPC